MSGYLKKEHFVWLAALVMAVHMVTFPFYQYPYVVSTGASWLGLDVSWQMMLNYADIHKLTWGKDIIYTYGPLGFLVTRIGWGIPIAIFILLDAFLVFNFYCIFRDFILRSANTVIGVVTIFLFTLIITPGYGAELPWVLLLFSFYWIYKTITTPRYVYYVLAILPLIISFYVKLNAGLVGILFLFGHIINQLVFKAISWKKSVIVISAILMAIGITSVLLHVSIPGYIKGASEIIKGYNDIMFLEMDGFRDIEDRVGILFYLQLAFLILCAGSLARKKKYAALYYVCLSFAYIFLLRKQSVLRNDTIHYEAYFAYAGTVLLPGFYKEVTKKKWFTGLFVLGIVLISLVMQSMNEQGYFVKALEARYTKQKQYMEQVGHYSKEKFLNNKDKRYIPATDLQKIGNNTIDVFPWDAEYIIENKLNYDPRPIFQSYSAYTDYLVGVNYKTYLDHAPEFILYDYETVDFRYPFNDDLLIHFFICKNYHIEDTFTSNGKLRLLLQKKKETSEVQLNKLSTLKGAVNEQISVPGNVQVIKAEVNYNLTGKLQAFLYRPPVLRIKMQTDDGTWWTYRCSKEMLHSGIMVDRLIRNSEQFGRYITNHISLPKITALQIVVDKDYYEREVSFSLFSEK